MIKANNNSHASHQFKNMEFQSQAPVSRDFLVLFYQEKRTIKKQKMTLRSRG
jgi:hypothetical protein